MQYFHIRITEPRRVRRYVPLSVGSQTEHTQGSQSPSTKTPVAKGRANDDDRFVKWKGERGGRRDGQFQFSIWGKNADTAQKT